MEEFKKEQFLLDAVIQSVISSRAFAAGLSNGHEMVVYRAKSGCFDAPLIPGDRVRVECSPYDMSQGRIVNRLESDHESS